MEPTTCKVWGGGQLLKLVLSRRLHVTASGDNECNQIACTWDDVVTSPDRAKLHALPMPRAGAAYLRCLMFAGGIEDGSVPNLQVVRRRRKRAESDRLPTEAAASHNSAQHACPLLVS